MTSRSNLRISDILPVLQGVKEKGGHYTATCPICQKENHLHMDTGDDGKVLCYCQKCNAKGDTLFPAFRALGAKPPEPIQIDYKAEKPVEDYMHVYRNPDGTEAYAKRRRKWADGHKVFSFQCRDAQGMTSYKKPDGCNNLYNLDLLAKGNTAEPLYIVEGEKCADAMVRAGLLATTSNTGAQKQIKLTLTDTEMLARYPVKVVIPDNDDKGATYAQAWSGAKILDLRKVWQDCPPKGDVADYFASGGTADAIRGYVFPVAPHELTAEYFAGLDKYGIVDTTTLAAILSVSDPSEREQVLTRAKFRASELKAGRDFMSCWKAYLRSEVAKGIRSDNMTQFPMQPLTLRCGEWSTDAHGIYRMVQSGNDFRREVASPIPLMPTEILANVEDDTEKIRLAYLKEGVWRSIVMPRSIVANKNKVVGLADFGIEVNTDNAGQLVKYIAETVALNPDILPRSQSIDHMGWHKNTFIPYADDIKLDCEDTYKTLIASVSERGSLDEWTAYIRRLRENVWLRIIMAASFASPLIERVNALPFVFHLWGNTGGGKTVSAMVAASIWGNPAAGKLVRTMNMTVNSMVGTAACLRNIPFFGDELQTIKNRIEGYDKLIMTICEGIERGRMTNAILQKQRTWLNAFIFTGEEPCTKSQSGGGTKNRVIEVECTEKIVTDGNAVVEFIANHYGCAGRAFIDGLDTSTLSKRFQENMRALLEGTDTTEKQAMAMALMWLADTLAGEILFPGEAPLTLDALKPFLKSASEVDMTARAFQEVMNMIAENQEKFARETIGGMGDISQAAHVCWGKIKEDGSGEVLINKSVLEREMERMGFDFTACKKKWAERGNLILDPRGRYSANLQVGGAKGQYVKLQNAGAK